MKLRTLVAASCVLAAVPAFGEITITSVFRETRADWSLSGAFPISLPPVIESNTTSGPWSSNINQGFYPTRFSGAAQTSDVSPAHITFAGTTSHAALATPSQTDMIAQGWSRINMGFHVDASTPIHVEVQAPTGLPLFNGPDIPGHPTPGLFLRDQGGTYIIARNVGVGDSSAFDRVLAPGDYTLDGATAFGVFGRVGFGGYPELDWFLNFTFDVVPAPASAVALLPLLGLAARRRRS